MYIIQTHSTYICGYFLLPTLWKKSDLAVHLWMADIEIMVYTQVHITAQPPTPGSPSLLSVWTPATTQGSALKQDSDQCGLCLLGTCQDEALLPWFPLVLKQGQVKFLMVYFLDIITNQLQKASVSQVRSICWSVCLHETARSPTRQSFTK